MFEELDIFSIAYYLQKYITSHKNPLELYNQNIYSHQTFTTTEEIISDIQKNSYTL